MKGNTMKTTTQLTAKQLANKLIKHATDAGVTLDAGTGDIALPNYWAVGGMVRPYGEFGALYYSPTGKPSLSDLEAVLTDNWAMIQIVGHLGVWRTDAGELFIDSVYRIPCGCDTEAGFSDASFRFAVDLAVSNDQDAICHVCEHLDNPLCFELK